MTLVSRSASVGVHPGARVALTASVVIPCFNERDTVVDLLERVRAATSA
jgi:hypothetical protein